MIKNKRKTLISQKIQRAAIMSAVAVISFASLLSAGKIKTEGQFLEKRVSIGELDTALKTNPLECNLSSDKSLDDLAMLLETSGQVDNNSCLYVGCGGLF